MRTVTEQSPISLADLREMASAGFGDLVKGVVDLERGIMRPVRDRIAELVRRLVRR